MYMRYPTYAPGTARLHLRAHQRAVMIGLPTNAIRQMLKENFLCRMNSFFPRIDHFYYVIEEVEAGSRKHFMPNG